jgi:hypothetical protein
MQIVERQLGCKRGTAEWRTLATTVGSPLRMLQLTYLDKQNFLLIILEHQTNANGVGTCNECGCCSPLAIQSSAGELFANW